MKENFNQITCDLCKKTLEYKEIKHYESSIKWVDRETNKEIDIWKSISIPIVFLTEQNEGTRVKPHLSYNEKLDLCPECYQRLIDEYPIIAYGAQGYNTYKWKTDEK